MSNCAFAVAGISLPDVIRQTPLMAAFKHSLKTHLFMQSFFSTIVV